jgi:hypothetical protein
MQVRLLEEVWKYENTTKSVDALFQRIEDTIKQDNLYLSNMLIDGIEVYEDYREYIVDRLTETLDVQVVLVTIDEMSEEILVSSLSYMERVIPEIRTLVNEFYQGPTSNSWDRFSQLLEGIQWIHQMIRSVDMHKQSSLKWGEYVSISQKLSEVGQNMQEAVENIDAVAIGDILNYELLPQLQSLYEQLQQESKVVNKHVN